MSSGVTQDAHTRQVFSDRLLSLLLKLNELVPELHGAGCSLGLKNIPESDLGSHTSVVLPEQRNKMGAHI
jgi:hypothetical protein